MCPNEGGKDSSVTCLLTISSFTEGENLYILEEIFQLLKVKEHCSEDCGGRGGGGGRLGERVDEKHCCQNLRVYKIAEGSGASLVAQWLGICLSMHETKVQSLAQEDPTWRGAAEQISPCTTTTVEGEPGSCSC